MNTFNVRWIRNTCVSYFVQLVETVKSWAFLKVYFCFGVFQQQSLRFYLIIGYFPLSTTRLLPDLTIWVTTRRVSYRRQEQVTIRGHLGLPPVFVGFVLHIISIFFVVCTPSVLCNVYFQLLILCVVIRFREFRK